jgi:hypothetical protein
VRKSSFPTIVLQYLLRNLRERELINLAKGWKPQIGDKRGRFEKHNRKNQGGGKKRLLDLARRRYFNFDLNDMLDDFGIFDNKNTISATISNKMITQSYDDAIGYVDRLTDDGVIDNDNSDRLKTLLKKYSRLR